MVVRASLTVLDMPLIDNRAHAHNPNLAVEISHGEVSSLLQVCSGCPDWTTELFRAELRATAREFQIGSRENVSCHAASPGPAREPPNRCFVTSWSKSDIHPCPIRRITYYVAGRGGTFAFLSIVRLGPRVLLEE